MIVIWIIEPAADKWPPLVSPCTKPRVADKAILVHRELRVLFTLTSQQINHLFGQPFINRYLIILANNNLLIYLGTVKL
jgi:hypothetical protein